MNKVIVILPVEERFDSKTGGAIFRWILEVYSRLDNKNYTILSKNMDDELHSNLNFECGCFFNLLLYINDRLSGLLFFFDKKRITRIFFIKGFLYLLSNKKQILSYDIAHIHNRPKYALLLRKLGFKGKIILHMHNDIENYASTDELIKLSNSVDIFIFCSDFIKNKAIKVLGTNVKCKTIYNGVYIKDELKIKKESLILLHAGRLIPEKGALEAIKIVHSLNKKGIDCCLKLVGAPDFGSNNDTLYSSNIKILAKKINLEYKSLKIDVLGHQSHEELLNIMSSSSIFIYPCLWEEPFGMVIIESMSRGTPVISLKKGGIPEIISDGHDGYLCDNIEDIETSVSKLITSGELEFFSTNALLKIKGEFSWDIIAGNIKRVFEQL